MATMTMTREQHHTRNPLPWLLLFCFLFAAVAYGTHAMDRHGGDASAVRQCIERNGPIATLDNPDTGRKALVCQLPDGKFGIQIRTTRFEVTSFVKEKMTKLDQVYRYLMNRGYQVMQ